MSYVSDTMPILSVAMNPCKAPVQLQKEDGSMMTLRGYSDAGSATTFIPERISKHVKQEDVEKRRVSYKGALKGTPIAQFTGYFSAPGSTTKLPTPICVSYWYRIVIWPNHGCTLHSIKARPSSISYESILFNFVKKLCSLIHIAPYGIGTRTLLHF